MNIMHQPWSEFRANDLLFMICNVKNRRSVCESGLEEIIIFPILIDAASCPEKKDFF